MQKPEDSGQLLPRVVVAGFAGETARTETGSIIHATTQNSAHIIPQERDIFIWDIGTVTDIMVMMRFDVDPVLILSSATTANAGRGIMPVPGCKGNICNLSRDRLLSLPAGVLCHLLNNHFEEPGIAPLRAISRGGRFDHRPHCRLFPACRDPLLLPGRSICGSSWQEETACVCGISLPRSPTHISLHHQPALADTGPVLPWYGNCNSRPGGLCSDRGAVPCKQGRDAGTVRFSDPCRQDDRTAYRGCYPHLLHHVPGPPPVTRWCISLQHSLQYLSLF